ncbi:histidine phosphatase family protein [Mucilaginibacter sp. CSA2-8R]|uniref:histidine phosphatase family protein n=1 Tax=Mucilaginibacter sp. CSA2-8R TaxID=3141542 RepID=UPI00315D9816
MKICFLLFAFIALFSQVTVAQKSGAQSPLKVIIIRHAEKPEKGDNLSCQGLNRAMQLPAVLVKQFGIPNYAYVPAPSVGKATKSGRMMQTIWPLAVKYNLTVNSKYDVDQTSALAKNILKRSGTVLVVWEHNNIADIAAALGADAKALNWKGNDYDTIWKITINGSKATLTTAKENLSPAANCNF